MANVTLRLGYLYYDKRPSSRKQWRTDRLGGEPFSILPAGADEVIQRSGPAFDASCIAMHASHNRSSERTGADHLRLIIPA